MEITGSFVIEAFNV